MPTLKALGAYGVESFHGPSEEGKDVYFAYKDIFGEYKHCCFFIKAGNIKKSGKNDIRKMKGAIEEALFFEFVSPIDNKTTVRIEEFYFVCSGKFNKYAREYLFNIFKAKQMPNVKIFDIDKLTNIILKVVRQHNNISKKQYIFDVKTFKRHCNDIIEYKEKEYTASKLLKHDEGKVIS